MIICFGIALSFYLTIHYAFNSLFSPSFDYSRPFLTWALTPPGFTSDLHVGVRTGTGKLVGFISGIPADIRVYDQTIHMVEINFLCVHKKIRYEYINIYIYWYGVIVYN